VCVSVFQQYKYALRKDLLLAWHRCADDVPAPIGVRNISLAFTRPTAGGHLDTPSSFSPRFRVRDVPGRHAVRVSKLVCVAMPSHPPPSIRVLSPLILHCASRCVLKGFPHKWQGAQATAFSTHARTRRFFCITRVTYQGEASGPAVAPNGPRNKKTWKPLDHKKGNSVSLTHRNKQSSRSDGSLRTDRGGSPDRDDIVFCMRMVCGGTLVS
jgi:hypothetical protein